MNPELRIEEFKPERQPGIDLLLEDVQKEYPETIYGAASKKMREVAFLADRKYWVVLDGDNIFGSIGLVCLENNNACLKSMFVHRDYRGSRQIAYHLLMTAVNYAINCDAKQIFLGTMIQFKAAQSFYLKHGFLQIPEGDLPADFVKNPVDKVFFRLQLPA